MPAKMNLWMGCLQYDLRAVFMHDGVYGRNHLYSYVNDNGTWWKTVDWVVTEASVERPPFRIEKGPQQLLAFFFSPPIGFGRDCFNGPDRFPPWRGALHAHLQSRHSRGRRRTPAMARRRRGTRQCRFFPSFFYLCLTTPSPCTAHSQRAVHRNNQLFLRDISQGTTSTATSETVEISVPSSTSVSGFTTPLEMPVTPGEAMDVSN